MSKEEPSEIRIRDAAKRRQRDFVAMFNALWYRDFPVVRANIEIGKRALWTSHIASVVKGSADLLGLFTCFESGNRTDAVIRKASPRRSTAPRFP